MPIYEYQGQYFDIADTDPVVAKNKILSYLGSQEAANTKIELPKKEGFAPAAESSFLNKALSLSRYLGGASEETHSKSIKNQQEVKEPENWYSPEAWGSVAGGAGVTLPAMAMAAPVATAALPAGAGGLTTAAVTGVAGSLLTSPAEGLNKYQALKDAGVDEETAKKAGIATGVIDAFGNALPGQGGLLGRFVKGGLQNAGANVAEGYATNAILGDDYQKQHVDPWDKKALMQGMVVGGGLGMMTGSKKSERWLRKNEEDVALPAAQQRLAGESSGVMGDTESKILTKHYEYSVRSLKNALEEKATIEKLINETGDASPEVVQHLQELEQRIQSTTENVSKLEAIFADPKQATERQRTDALAKKDQLLNAKIKELKENRPPSVQREIPNTPENAAAIDEGIARSEGWSNPVDPVEPKLDVAKTSPVEIAAAKIGQAMGNVERAKAYLAEIRGKIAEAQQRPNSVGPGGEYNSRLQAMIQEEKAYLDIIAGKQPDLSWFDNALQTHVEAPRSADQVVPDMQPLSIEDHAAMDAAFRSSTFDERPAAGIEHTLQDPDWNLSKDPANSFVDTHEPYEAGLFDNNLDPTQANIPDTISSMSAASAINKFKFEAQKAQSHLDRINKQIADAALFDPGTVDLAGLHQQRAWTERRVAQYENAIQRVLRDNPTLIKDPEFAGTKEAVKAGESLVTEPKQYSSIDEAVLAESDHLPFVFDNNKGLFNTGEGVKAVFDKNMPALQQKILTHFIKTLGLENEKLYFIHNNNTNELGNCRFYGNSAVLAINEAKSSARQSLVDKALGGKLSTASKAFYDIRIATHEMGHFLLNKYLHTMSINTGKTKIPFNEIPLVVKLQKQFDSLEKADFQPISPADLTKTKQVENRQKYFHEFFADQVTKELLYFHTLGAFTNNRGQWITKFGQLISTSMATLRKHKVEIDRRSFVQDIVNDLIVENKASIEATGKTIWENFQLRNRDKQVFAGWDMEKTITYERGNSNWHMPSSNKGDNMADNKTGLFSLSAINKLVTKVFPKNNLALIFKDNPHIAKAYDVIRTAEIHATKLSKKIWFGDESYENFANRSILTRFSDIKDGNSPYHTVKKMSDLEAYNIHQVFQRGLEEGLMYDKSLELYGQHLTEKERQTFLTLAKMYGQQYQGIVDMQKQLGKKHVLEYRPGWYPSERMGEWFVTLKFDDNTIFRQHFPTEVAAKKFIERTNKEQFKYLTVTAPEKKDVSSILAQKEHDVSQIDTICNMLEQKYKQSGAGIVKDINNLRKIMAERGGKFGKHHEERSNMLGYKGSELFMTPEELGRSFKEATIESVDSYAAGIRKLYMDTHLRPMLEVGNLDENTHMVVKQMYDTASNRVENIMEKPDTYIREGVEKMVRKVLDSKVAGLFGVEYKGNKAALDTFVGGTLELLYLWKIMSKGAFILSQPMSSVQAIRHMSYDGGYLKPWISYGKGLWNLTTGNKELKQAMFKSRNESNTFEPQFIDSLHLTEESGPILTAMKDWIMLRKPAEIADTLSRAFTYSAMFTHYRSMGHNFDTAVRLAERGTDSTMIVYGNRDSGAIWQHAGFLGTMARPLQTFPTAALGNFIADARNMSLKDYKSAAPMLNYVLSTILLSGVMGLQFITEYEMIRKWMEDKDPGSGPPAVADIMLQDPTFDERIDADPEAYKKAFLLGVPALSGIDLASSLRSNETFATTLVGVATGQKAFYEALPLINLGVDVVGGVSTLAKAKIAETMGVEGYDLSVAQRAKAITDAFPAGAISYAKKEYDGVNETRLFGENTGMKQGGKEGEATTERTTTDKVAGYLGTKSTEDRTNLLVNMRKQELDKRRNEQIKKNANLFIETGKDIFLQRLIDTGLSDEQLENRLGNTVYKKLVDQRLRYIANKQGNVNPNKVQRAVSYGDIPE